jgi:hypothetical protein
VTLSILNPIQPLGLHPVRASRGGLTQRCQLNGGGCPLCRHQRQLNREAACDASSQNLAFTAHIVMDLNSGFSSVELSTRPTYCTTRPLNAMEITNMGVCSHLPWRKPPAAALVRGHLVLAAKQPPGGDPDGVPAALPTGDLRQSVRRPEFSPVATKCRSAHGLAMGETQNRTESPRTSSSAGTST